MLVEVPKCVGSDSQDVQICAPAQLKFFFREKKKSDMTGFVLLSQRWAGAPFWGKEET